MTKHIKKNSRFVPLNIAVLTVSDTRTEATDEPGKTLLGCLTQDGYILVDQKIVKDDIYQLRAVISVWIATSDIQVVLVTGGTGFTARDSTPEALAPLFDRHVDSFGELFRQISYEEIGTSAIQSRALAGLTNGTLIACMPGSPNACRCGGNAVLRDQLDSRQEPCNFVQHSNPTDCEVTSIAQVDALCDPRC